MLNRTLPYYLEDRTGVHTASDYDDIYDRLFLRVSCTHPPPISRSSSSSSTNSASSSLTNASPLASLAADAPLIVTITNTGRRSSTRAHLRGTPSPHTPPPSIVLEFGPHNTLGTVILGKRRLPMGTWLKKTGVFAGSLSRRFVGSDGREYRWVRRAVPEQEWTLLANTPTPTSQTSPLSASCPTSRSLLSSSPTSTSPPSPPSFASKTETVVAAYTLKPPGRGAFDTSGNVLMIGEAWGALLGAEILASLTVMRHIEVYGL